MCNLHSITMLQDKPIICVTFCDCIKFIFLYSGQFLNHHWENLFPLCCTAHNQMSGTRLTRWQPQILSGISISKPFLVKHNSVQTCLLSSIANVLPFPIQSFWNFKNAILFSLSQFFFLSLCSTPAAHAFFSNKHQEKDVHRTFNSSEGI